MQYFLKIKTNVKQTIKPHNEQSVTILNNDRIPPCTCSAQPYFPHLNPSPVESCLWDFGILFIMDFFCITFENYCIPTVFTLTTEFLRTLFRFVPDGSAYLLPSQPSQNIYVFSFGTYLPWPRCFLKTSLFSNKSLRTHSHRKWLDQQTIRFGKRLSSLLRKNSSNKQNSLGGFVTKGETGWQLSWSGRSNVWQTRVPPTRTPRPCLP